MLAANLIKGPDFQATVRYRTNLFRAMITLGVLGAVCYFLLVPNSGLSSFVQGLYAGVAAGLLVGGWIGLLHLRQLKKNPEVWKKAAVRSTDEREQTITAQAWQTACLVLFYGMVAAMLVAAPLNLAVFWTLWIVCILLGLLLRLFRVYYSHKL